MFILPRVFIGAGFVISTTVRTAIVFASTSKGIPGTAAALNQASVDLGSRIGIVASTTVLAATATQTFTRLTEGLPGSQELVDQARAILVALGTTGFAEMVAEARFVEQTATWLGYIGGDRLPWR